jgi:hypothetical protein
MEPKLEISDQITAAYHGTSLPEAQEIKRTNFKLTPPNAGAFLGEGVYFFDNQPSQAKKWAVTRKATPGGAVAVIQSKVRYGRLLNLTDREHREILDWFAREFQRKANMKATLPAIIDIAADKLQAEVVKAIRIPQNATFLLGTGFCTDIEVILAVRNVTNILSTEIIWSQMVRSV